MTVGFIILLIVCIIGLIYFSSLQRKKEKISDLNTLIAQLKQQTETYQASADQASRQLRSFQDMLSQKAFQIDVANKELSSIVLEVEQKKNSIDRDLNLYITQANSQKEEKLKEIEDIEKQRKIEEQNLEDFRSRRRALNRVLMEEQKKKAEKEPCSIWLSETDKRDITYLISILPEISQREVLLKLIWSSYLQKPLNDMLHRICGASTPKNVVYMIRNMETEQIYIGKTTDYMERMKQHIKASLQIGTISHQKIHDALFNEWDKFYFDILESDIKNLNEREKYYIQMFESDVYGYNMKG